MSATSRFLSTFCYALILVVVLAAAYCFKSFTPPIFGAEAISELKAVEINGTRQYILIRGRDRSAPVLLFLHGGPGMPAMYLAHDFQRQLENDFVIVHWDQRGAGKSFRKGIDPASMTISQLLEDTNAVIGYLRETLAVNDVWIVGHSHGSYLGTLYSQQYPERVAALVGIGQVTDPVREREMQDAFLKSRLASLGLPEDMEITDENREDLLFRTNSELFAAQSFMPLVWSGLQAMEYNLFDIMRIAKGSSFSSTHMTYDVAGGRLSGKLEFKMPVVVIMGEHDMTTPTPLAKEFFDGWSAPDKVWIEFSRSAHFPFFEEPERFTTEMRRLKAQFSD
jgi:L-proline amide hydrolase